MVLNPRLQPQFAMGKDHRSPSKSYCAPQNLQWSSASLRKPEMHNHRPTQAPLFAMNALDEECNVKPDPSSSLLEVINANWNNLSQADREKVGQIVAQSSNAPPAAYPEPNRVTVINKHVPKALSHSDIPPSRSKAKSKGKPKAKGDGQSKFASSRKRKECVEEESSDDDDWEPPRSDQPCISFRIDDEEKVVAFFHTRFMQIQQSAGKVIAKAWIKAICPKKQANYPYVDSNPRHGQKSRRPRHNGPPRIPNFWPNLSLCRHKEPDHLDKHERTHLLIHLLRIHWGPEDWKGSNGETAEVPVFVMSDDWVQFLRDTFPPERLAEVTGSTPAKTRQRMQYLSDIYKVALAYQEMKQGGNDGGTMFTFTGDIKLIHPKDAEPRRPRYLVSSADGNRQVDQVTSFATSANSSPRTVPATPSEGSACATTPEEDRDGSDSMSSRVDTMPAGDAETAPTSQMASSQSDMALSPAPWAMVDNADSGNNLMNQPMLQVDRVFKAEAPEPRNVSNVSAYFEPMMPHGGAQAPLNTTPGWGDSLFANMAFCGSGPQANFPNEPVSLGGGMPMAYREDPGVVDPMLEGLSLRSPTAEETSYVHSQAQQPSMHYGMHPMMCSAGPPQGPTFAGMMMVGKQECDVDHHQRQYAYMAHPMRPVPYRVQYGPQMPMEGQHDFPHGQLEMMPGYPPF